MVAGDIVVLKSNEKVKMTVEDVTEYNCKDDAFSEVLCVWFDNNMNLCREIFDGKCIKLFVC